MRKDSNKRQKGRGKVIVSSISLNVSAVHTGTRSSRRKEGEKLLKLPLIGFSNAGNLHKVGKINDVLSAHNSKPIDTARY